MTIGDHIDTLDGGDGLHILQPLQRLDGGAQDDIFVRPRRVFGGVPGAMALVLRMRSLSGETTVADGRVLGQLHDGARLLGIVHLGDLDAHDTLVQDTGDHMHEGLVQPHDG